MLYLLASSIDDIYFFYAVSNGIASQGKRLRIKVSMATAQIRTLYSQMSKASKRAAGPLAQQHAPSMKYIVRVDGNKVAAILYNIGQLLLLIATKLFPWDYRELV